jgi:hypothetical protein
VRADVEWENVMNPYREPMPQWSAPSRKNKKSYSGHIALVCILAGFASLQLASGLQLESPLDVVLGPVLAVLGHASAVVVLIVAHLRSLPTARLARLVWHRGDRFGAAFVFLGIGSTASACTSSARASARTS